MSNILSRGRRTGGLAAVVAAGLALAGCTGLAQDGGYARYAQNISPRVASDVIPTHRHAPVDDEACVPSLQTFSDDCGGFSRYDGP